MTSSLCELCSSADKGTKSPVTPKLFKLMGSLHAQGKCHQTVANEFFYTILAVNVDIFHIILAVNVDIFHIILSVNVDIFHIILAC
ncbi:hypothetical protein BgiMline_023694 [Biomphalaria glabrata]